MVDEANVDGLHGLAVVKRDVNAMTADVSGLHGLAVIERDVNAMTSSVDGLHVLAIISRTHASRVAPTSFSPSSGIPGTVVTILGSALDLATGVKFGGVSATVWVAMSPYVIVAVVPLDAVTGSASVVDALGPVSPPGTYTVIPSPADHYVFENVALFFVYWHNTEAYIYENVNTGTPVPHLWYLYPTEAFRGQPVYAVGMGLGDNQAEFSSRLSLEQENVTIMEWFRAPADGSGLTEDRQIRPETDRANPEHQRIRFVVPADGQSGNVRAIEDS